MSAANHSDQLDRQEPRRSYRYLDLVMVLFVTILITSNIASSAKIVDWGVSLIGLRLAFDAGTILFPISYIFGDVLTEVYGYRQSRRVIWAGFAALALTALVLWLVRIMPGEATWQSYAGQQAYDQNSGWDELGRDRLRQPGGLFCRRVYQFLPPGSHETAHPRALAVDAHHRQHPGR